MAENRRNSFYIQGTILALASVFSRIIGFVFGIFLSKILDDEGYGAYQNAYEVYSLALLLSTNSIPLAVSRLVSQRESNKQYNSSFRVFKVSFTVSAILGFIMAAIVYFFAKPISVLVFDSPDTAIPLRFLAPTIFIFAILGALRGFFQGKKTVIPTSISQVIEQVVHVVFGLVAANLLLLKHAGESNAAAYGAAGGTIGTLFGAVVAFAFLGIVYLMYRPLLKRRLLKDPTGIYEDYFFLLKVLILTVLPIIANQVLYNITSIMGLSFMHKILSDKGVSEVVRNVYASNYSGKFVKLTNVPIAIASGLGMAIIPGVVSAHTKGSLRLVHSSIYQAIKFNMMISIPCAFGLIALAEPIMSIFGGEPDIAIRLMHIGGLSVVLYAYATISNSVLQGIGRLLYPVIHAFIGIMFFVAVELYLLMYTDMGVYSLAIGYMVFPLVVSILNFIRIKKEARYYQEIFRTFVCPTVFSILMALVAFISNLLFKLITKSNLISIIVSVILSIGVYGILMVATKTISEKEIVDLPFGNKLLIICKKIGFYSDEK